MPTTKKHKQKRKYKQKKPKRKNKMMKSKVTFSKLNVKGCLKGLRYYLSPDDLELLSKDANMLALLVKYRQQIIYLINAGDCFDGVKSNLKQTKKDIKQRNKVILPYIQALFYNNKTPDRLNILNIPQGWSKTYAKQHYPALIKERAINAGIEKTYGT